MPPSDDLPPTQPQRPDRGAVSRPADPVSLDPPATAAEEIAAEVRAEESGLPPHENRTLEIARVLALAGVFIGVASLIGAVYSLKLAHLYRSNLHVSASFASSLAIITALGSYLQPFMGAWSDLRPLFGYRRKSYYALAILVESLSFVVLAEVPHPGLWLVVAMVTLIGTCASMMGVVVNAAMVAIGNLTGTFGMIQAVFTFVPVVLAMVLVPPIQAYTVMHWSLHACMLAASGLVYFRLICLPLIDEQRMQRVEGSTPAAVKERERRRAEDRRKSAALQRAIRTPGLWVLTVFIFYLILTPGTNSAAYYYYRGALNLSDAFVARLGYWGNGGALLALAVFFYYSRRMPIWSMVWGAWIIDVVGYPIAMAIHSAHSAEWMAFSGGVTGILYGVFLNTLAARACPPGIEGTIYGLVLAAEAIAGVLSNKFGAWLYDYFGPGNPHHHYTVAHGWMVANQIGLLFTLCAIIFIPFLPRWTRSSAPIGSMPEET